VVDDVIVSITTECVVAQPSISESVIGAFYEVYNTLGFGFLEHIYIMALERELRNRGHQVRREVGVCVMYKGRRARLADGHDRR
jgi:GxxExxY protein